MSDEKKVHYLVVKNEEDADAVAWVFTSKDSFEKEFIRLPDLKSNEIKARVLYTSICHLDSMIGRGEWGHLEYPICPGHEIIGQVVKKGVAVDNLEVGDIVGIGPFVKSCNDCKFCKIGWNHACENMSFEDRFIYNYRFGGFATHVQQPAKYCIKIPKGIDLHKASPFLCAGITVFTPMSMYIKPDDKVAILGCGGLGHLAVQFAKKMAKEVTVITHTVEKIDYIKKLGPDKILLRDDFLKNTPDLEYDVIVHTLPVWSSHDEVKKWIDSLTSYGRLILLGVSPNNKPMYFDVNWLTLKSNLVIGSCAGGIKQMQEIFDFVEQNNIECLCEYYDFNDFDKALQKVEKGHPLFRIVVTAEKAAIHLENRQK